MNSSAGTTSAKPPANRKASGESDSEVSTWAGSVRLFNVSTAAASTSFQDSTNVKIAAAAMPGSAIGATTRRNASNRVQPNSCAASSTSRGTETNTLAVIRMVVGSDSAECTSTTASTLS